MLNLRQARLRSPLSECSRGTIPPGDGGRFVSAATDHLQDKLHRLEARMRSLEDALAIAQSADSDSPHPLLSAAIEELEEESQHLTPPREEDDRPDSPPIDAFGTLCIGTEGGSRFFGSSGGSEALLLSSGVDRPKESIPSGPRLEELDPSFLPPEINQCYQAFPFAPPNVSPSTLQPKIEAFLPTMERAISLCDTYLEHLSWMFQIVSRHKLVNELIPAIYKRAAVRYGPHDLSLLLAVLAVGSLVDLNLQPYNLEAQLYYRLCRATLALQSVLGSQSVTTVKVLHLMSVYNGMSGKESNLEQSYRLLDLAGQVALRIGFHMDPSMWGIEGREAYDRRVYFWNLMAGILWQSLVTGRPPSILMSYVGCRIPSPDDENLYQEGEVPLGFGIWGFAATSECLIPLARTVLAARAPEYKVVQELDRKIREVAVPRSNSTEGRSDRTALTMRSFVRAHYQDLMLLFLHRAHFAHAMSSHPDNPMLSPYSQSVSAAYASSCIILQDTRAQFQKRPFLCARIWRIWSFTFSAAIVVGTLAIQGVHLNLKPPPLEEFEAICTIFTTASETSSRAARALPVLLYMLEKARQAHRYYQEHGKAPPDNSAGIDALAYFSGHAKVIHDHETQSIPTAQRMPQYDRRHSGVATPVAGTSTQSTPRRRPPQGLSVEIPSSSSTRMRQYQPFVDASERWHHPQQEQSQQSMHPSYPPLTVTGMPTGQLQQPHQHPHPHTQHSHPHPQHSHPHLHSHQPYSQSQTPLTPSYPLASPQMPIASTSRATLDPRRRQSQGTPAPQPDAMLDERWANYVNPGFLSQSMRNQNPYK